MARLFLSRIITCRRAIGTLAVFVLTTIATSDAAAPGASTNLERLEQCAADAADSLLTFAGSRDSLCLSIVAHDAGWVIERAFIERATSRGMAVHRCDDVDARRIDVAIREIGVVYHVTDDDEIAREARLDISANIGRTGNAGPGLETRRVSVTRVDTVSADDTLMLADANYRFTDGVAAATPSAGFWKRIVEPAVVLAASAIIVILLFSVRSQ